MPERRRMKGSAEHLSWEKKRVRVSVRCGLKLMSPALMSVTARMFSCVHVRAAIHIPMWTSAATAYLVYKQTAPALSAKHEHAASEVVWLQPSPLGKSACRYRSRARNGRPQVEPRRCGAATGPAAPRSSASPARVTAGTLVRLRPGRGLRPGKSPDDHGFAVALVVNDLSRMLVAHNEVVNTVGTPVRGGVVATHLCGAETDIVTPPSGNGGETS